MVAKKVFLFFQLFQGNNGISFFTSFEFYGALFVYTLSYIYGDFLSNLLSATFCNQKGRSGPGPDLRFPLKCINVLTH